MALDIKPPKRDVPRLGPRRTDMSALLRLGAWGGGAALALAALALTIQSDTGTERLQYAFAAPAEPGRAVALVQAPLLPHPDAETQALEAQVRALIADRDRMAMRLASLERQFDDVTGSIERQAAQPAPAPVASAPAPSPPTVSTPVSASPAAQVASIARHPAAPATTAVAATPLPPTIDPLAMPAVNTVAAAWPPSAQPADTAPAMADPLPEPVPLPPPSRVAAIAPNERPAGPASARKYEYGIELATAPDMDALRARWATVKANHGPLLVGLQPVAVHERPPAGSKYRLIAGPLPNYAKAKEACARFSAVRAACRPARFDPNSIVQR